MSKYDTLGARIGAAVLDSLIMIPVTLAVSFLAAFASGFSMIGAVLLNVLPAVISLFYVVLMHTFFGQTLGKMAMKVKLVDDSERPVIFGQAVLRSLPQVAYVIFVLTFAGRHDFEIGSTTLTLVALFWILYVLFQLIDIGLFLMNDKHRALHDFIAKTVVIRTDK